MIKLYATVAQFLSLRVKVSCLFDKWKMHHIQDDLGIAAVLVRQPTAFFQLLEFASLQIEKTSKSLRNCMDNLALEGLPVCITYLLFQKKHLVF